MMGKPQREEHKVALLIACAVRKQRYQELAPLYSCKPHSQRYSSSIHAPPLKVPQPSKTLWLQGLSEHRCSGDLPSSHHSRATWLLGSLWGQQERPTTPCHRQTAAFTAGEWRSFHTWQCWELSGLIVTAQLYRLDGFGPYITQNTCWCLVSAKEGTKALSYCAPH